MVVVAAVAVAACERALVHYDDTPGGPELAIPARSDLKDQAIWRTDIDALLFLIDEHAAFCAVHRRAFRTLLGSEPTPEDCLNYFGDFEHAFRAAANSKIAQNGLSAGKSFHLTSRDVARKLIESEPKEQGE